jgi:ferredoxin-NADP reductase
MARAAVLGRLTWLAIQRLDDGEVSPYLTEVLSPGNLLELRGPIGGYFAWHPGDPQPILLIGGGSGVVPLESAARLLVEQGIADRQIRTERFGPSGGTP